MIDWDLTSLSHVGASSTFCYKKKLGKVRQWGRLRRKLKTHLGGDGSISINIKLWTNSANVNTQQQDGNIQLAPQLQNTTKYIL